MQKFQQLRCDVLVQCCQSGRVAARPSKACNKTITYRVIHGRHDYRDDRGGTLRRPGCRDCIDNDYANTLLSQLAGKLSEALVVSLRPAQLEHIVLALDQSVFT